MFLVVFLVYDNFGRLTGTNNRNISHNKFPKPATKPCKKKKQKKQANRDIRMDTSGAYIQPLETFFTENKSIRRNGQIIFDWHLFIFTFVQANNSDIEFVGVKSFVSL